MDLRKKIKNFFTLTRKANAGFTLVELIVVIAILAILGGVAVPAYSGYVKKAERSADEALLNELNTAFASACAMHGEDHYGRSDTSIKLTESNGAKVADANSVTVTGIADFSASFGSLFEGGSFKVFDALYYAREAGGFVATELSEAYSAALEKILTTMGAEIGLVQSSKFAGMGAESLLGAVDDVTAFAALTLQNGSGKIFEMVDTDAYRANLMSILDMEPDEFLAYYNEKTNNSENPRGFDQVLANSTVLSVAKTVNSEGYAAKKAELIGQLSSGKLADVIGAITNDQNSSEESLAAAALIYGLYTAHNPNKANEVVVSRDFSAILEDDSGFTDYLKGLSTEGSQANNDMKGYFAALDIVDEAVSDPDVARQVLENGYKDQELVGIVGSVIGG